MILPTKYVKLENSYYYKGGIILSLLKNKKMSIDLLWKKVSSSKYSASFTLTNFVETLIYLYSLGYINANYDDGGIYNDNYQLKNI